MACILVVDDEHDVRLGLTQLLEEAGHDVVEAPDGAYVQIVALRDSPDVILLDVTMPKVTGFEALAKLKADARTADIPVIMVTAKGRPQDLHQARSLGALDYINKPWAKGEVVLRTEWALNKAARKKKVGSAPQRPN